MTDVAMRAHVDPWSVVRRFLRTPKGLLIVVLAMLLPIAATGSGWRVVAPGVLSAAIAAMLVDAPILRWREKVWEFPSGALLTGLLVAMVLSPHEHHQQNQLLSEVFLQRPHPHSTLD